MRTSARITSIDAASAGKSTASFPACTTSATPFKSLLCRQTHDLPTGIHPSQLGLRSNHRPPDGGRPARSRRLCFFLAIVGGPRLAVSSDDHLPVWPQVLAPTS